MAGSRTMVAGWQQLLPVLEEAAVDAWRARGPGDGGRRRVVTTFAADQGPTTSSGPALVDRGGRDGGERALRGVLARQLALGPYPFLGEVRVEVEPESGGEGVLWRGLVRVSNRELPIGARLLALQEERMLRESASRADARQLEMFASVPKLLLATAAVQREVRQTRFQAPTSSPPSGKRDAQAEAMVRMARDVAQAVFGGQEEGATGPEVAEGGTGPDALRREGVKGARRAEGKKRRRFDAWRGLVESE